MATMHTRKWISFFQEAGIQDHAQAVRYAAIFVDNEIHSSMLKELDMELLRLMGISKVGHVLGILKHAKLVHDTQLFAPSQSSPASRSQSSGTSSPVIVEDTIQAHRPQSVKNSRPSATSRVIEHYVKKPEATTVVTSPRNVPAVTRVAASTKKPRPKVMDRLGSVAMTEHSQASPSPSSRLAPSSRKKTKFTITNIFETEPQATLASPSIKQRTGNKTKITDRLGTKPNVVAPKRKPVEISVQPKVVAEEVPVKRVRRVLPEHEGGYSIRMPSGSTPRSREILAKMAPRHPMTVFDRLGDAAVSSTTEVEEPTITITGFGTQIVKTGNSVFSRLGDKRAAPSVPVPQQPAVQGVKARLGNQVTLKASKVESSMKIESRFQSQNNTSSCTMSVKQSTTASGEVQYVGVLKKPTPKKTPNLQSRLGTKPTTVTPSPNPTSAKRNSSAGILGNPTNTTKLSAKDRLDLSARDSSNTTRPTKTRKFIMTNKKTGVKTIVYKMSDDDDVPHRF